jgi:hypothetical protein
MTHYLAAPAKVAQSPRLLHSSEERAEASLVVG